MIILLTLFIVGLLTIAAARFGTKQVPWSKHLKRVHAGTAAHGEWLAPEAVLEQVKVHYRETIHWLQDIASDPGNTIENAADYLSGDMLRRFERQIQYRQTTPLFFVGVLRADHEIDVRYFSSDGQSCLVVDHQTEQRIATYDAETHHRILTQDMGESTLVYRMIYDLDDERWKLDEFVQTLPFGWHLNRKNRHIQVLSTLSSPNAGRDN